MTKLSGAGKCASERTGRPPARQRTPAARATGPGSNNRGRGHRARQYE
ncbi:MAG: hypothetical protein ACRDRJ_12850 [Streptosporangiaceae bacterium]